MEIIQRQYGWRTAKRPGVDYFLAYLSQFYEIVLFTTQHNYVIIPLTSRVSPRSPRITRRQLRSSRSWIRTDSISHTSCSVTRQSQKMDAL